MKYGKVCVIVLNWNGWQDTIECLDALETLTYPNYHTVLIDNGSKDDSVEQLTNWLKCRNIFSKGSVESNRYGSKALAVDHQIVNTYPMLDFIVARENLGFSGGNNLGIEYALNRPDPATFVFLLNNDTKAESACLTACVKVAEEQGAGIVGAIIKSYKDSEVLFAGARFPGELFITNRFRSPPDSVGFWPVGRVEGSGMLIRGDLLSKRKEEYGYFLDPDLFMYCEDSELCGYAKRSGYGVYVAEKAVVYHKVTYSSGGTGSALSYYYITRNRIRLAIKFLPLWLRFLFHLWYVPSRIVQIVRRFIQRKPNVAMATIEGLIDGYKGITGKWRKHNNE